MVLCKLCTLFVFLMQSEPFDTSSHTLMLSMLFMQPLHFSKNVYLYFTANKNELSILEGYVMHKL